MATGPSKMVECEICSKQVRARGLHAHMRQIHHIVIETVTKVVEADHSPTIVEKGGDLSGMTKVVERVTTYKKVEIVPGHRGAKVQRSHHDFINQLDAHIGAGKNFMPISSNEVIIKIESSVDD